MAPIYGCVQPIVSGFVHAGDILFLVEEVFDPLLIKMTFLNGSFILQPLNIV